MASSVPSASGTAIVPRPVAIVPHLREQLARQQHTPHKHFAPPGNPDPQWISYASQNYVRDMVVDAARAQVWLATWGGILCWQHTPASCIRHTSAHGLIGNATRCLTLDQQGRVWAAGQTGGLSCLVPDTHHGWQICQCLVDWTVLRLVAHPQTGVYAAIEDQRGVSALAWIATPDAAPHMLTQDELCSRAIAALFVDAQATLWIGNAWGLHRYQPDGTLDTLNLSETQYFHIYAIEPTDADALWLGTNHGLYHYQPAGQPALTHMHDWPADAIRSLAHVPDNGELWVVTASAIGRVIDQQWHPHPKASTDCDMLCYAGTLPSPTSAIQPRGDILAAGSNGVWWLTPTAVTAAFSPDAEDALSNAVQCLDITSTTVRVGSARGVCAFDGQTWHNDAANGGALRDARALVADQLCHRLWVGTWRGGLCRLEQDVFIPSPPALEGPIIALACATDGTLWAATLESLYTCAAGQRHWQPLDNPVRTHLRGRIIQTICPQLITSTNGRPVCILWVGTSAGLLRYRPEMCLWDTARDWGAADNLEQLPIQTLGCDPRTNQLWVGTAAGLFCETDWHCYYEADVRSLAFSPTSLWVGTSQGLAQWLLPDTTDGLLSEPVAHFTATNAGLAANTITALATRMVNDIVEVWIGTTAGVSCYRYKPNGE